MGFKKIRGEGGAGGKRSYSNMEHWAYTREIARAVGARLEDAARNRRRIDDRQVVREQSRTATEKIGLG